MAFPSSDYYGGSVALSLSAFRQSRLPSQFHVSRNFASEPAVDAPFAALSDFANHRLVSQKVLTATTSLSYGDHLAMHVVSRDVRFHRWRLGFG